MNFQEGEFAIRAGESYQKIYHIVRGSCNVEIERDGEHVIINRMQENTTFGEMSFILQSEDSEYKASASVIAAEEVEISIIEGYFLNILFDMHPGLGLSPFFFSPCFCFPVPSQLLFAQRSASLSTCAMSWRIVSTSKRER